VILVSILKSFNNNNIFRQRDSQTSSLTQENQHTKNTKILKYMYIKHTLKPIWNTLKQLIIIVIIIIIILVIVYVIAVSTIAVSTLCVVEYFDGQEADDIADVYEVY